MGKKILIPIILLISLLCTPSIICSQSFPDNLAGYADVTVSDEYNYDYSGYNAIDRQRQSDWAARGARNKWILLNWPYPINISFIKLINRQTGVFDPINSSELILSDGSIFYVGTIKTHGRKLININREGIFWVKYLIHSGVNNVGLSEILVIGADTK
ncbi:MAG: hypothetical protein GY714_16475 [Desulfobacterales bacterium]|nr:hypothetical protein [Desulfobacterales bacterium]MCP4160562.1 hypothetical protein [Deltaproteobacteria bacterium]